VRAALGLIVNSAAVHFLLWASALVRAGMPLPVSMGGAGRQISLAVVLPSEHRSAREARSFLSLPNSFHSASQASHVRGRE
jgi:hypothetical protein